MPRGAEKSLREGTPDPMDNYRDDDDDDIIDPTGTGGRITPQYKTADEMMDFDAATDDWGIDASQFRKNPLVESEEEKEARLEAEREREEDRQRAVRDELDRRTGRGWTDPWEIKEDEWYKDRGWDDTPDWTTEFCSRVSKERLNVMDDGVPTLETVAHTAVPPGRLPHPADVKNKAEYIRDRARRRWKSLRAGIEELAGDEVERILAMEDWQDKQDAVDVLYEDVEAKLREREDVLRHHPNFGRWVERAMEQYLIDVARRERETFEAAESSSNDAQDGGEGGPSASEVDAGEGSGGEDASGDDDDAGGDEEQPPMSLPTPDDDASALPTFVNLLPPDDRPDAWPVDSEGSFVRTTDTVVPEILHPLSLHKKGNAGRLVEEWELAAHPGRRHVMLRQCVRDAARSLWEADRRTGGEERCARIMMTGKLGTGKTSALASLVAFARSSEYVVMYLPDGDRLRHLGKYIQPSKDRKDEDGSLLFDLPWLSKEVCGQLLRSHGTDLEGMTCPEERLDEFFGKEHLRKFREMVADSEDEEEKEGGGGGGEVKIVDLLRAGSQKENVAPACYSLAVDHLLRHQDDKPFLVVMDEFNCYFDHLHYFHMDYDEDVRWGIPPQRISLFKPLVESLGLYRAENIKGLAKRMEGGPKPIRRGGIVVGNTESRAVARKFTDALVEVASASASVGADDDEAKEEEIGSVGSGGAIEILEVPAYSELEVEHALANFEVTGIGRLRFDRGATVMDEQEVAFLRMVSSSVPQRLMEACIV